MKTIMNKEELKETITEINENRDANCELSEAALRFWNGLGKTTIDGSEGIEAAAEALGVEIQTFSHEERKTANEKFLNACGFTKFNQPLFFYWGGNGDATWLIDMTEAQMRDLIFGIAAAFRIENSPRG